jgi:hypothetical protein
VGLSAGLCADHQRHDAGRDRWCQPSQPHGRPDKPRLPDDECHAATASVVDGEVPSLGLSITDGGFPGSPPASASSFARATAGPPVWATRERSTAAAMSTRPSSSRTSPQ